MDHSSETANLDWLTKTSSPAPFPMRHWKLQQARKGGSLLLAAAWTANCC
jgi:hypothetical protein